MASHGTILKYGDVTIVNCLTRQFRQESVFDDSGTDLLYHKFTITVVGFVHGDEIVLASLDGEGNPKSVGPSVAMEGAIPVIGTAAQAEVFIRGYLLHPRRSFLMAMNVPLDNLGAVPDTANVLLQCEGNPSTFGQVSAVGIDVNNGPKPQSLSITQVSANKIFKVEYTIEVCKLECDHEGGNSNTHGVLSNRWSVDEDVDENFYTTRTITGRLKVARSTVNPLDFRGIVVPSLPGGFRRQSMKFIVPPDGLSMDYTIIDREFAFSPPFPATSWMVRHTESVTSAMIAHTEITIRLTGPRLVSKKVLITRAAQIIWAKIFGYLQQPNQQDKDQYMIEHLSITDVTSDVENTVEAYCKVLIRGTKTEDANVDPVLVHLSGTRFPDLGKPLDGGLIPEISSINLPAYTPGICIDPYKEMDTDFGCSWLPGSFTAHLQSACHADMGAHAFDSGNPPNPPWIVYDPNQPETEIQVFESPVALPEPQEDRSGSFSQAIYTEYQADDRYTTNLMRVQMPIAKSNISNSQNQGQGGNAPTFSPSGNSSGSSGSGEPINASKTSVAIALSRPVMTRVIRIRATRVGAWPQLPQPNDIIPQQGSMNGPQPNNQVLLNHKFFPQTPVMNGSGQYIFTVDAEYEYSLDRNLEPTEKYELSLAPWLKLQVQQLAPQPYPYSFYYDPQASNLFESNNNIGPFGS